MYVFSNLDLNVDNVMNAASYMPHTSASFSLSDELLAILDQIHHGHNVAEVLSYCLTLC